MAEQESNELSVATQIRDLRRIEYRDVEARFWANLAVRRALSYSPKANPPIRSARRKEAERSTD